MKKQQTSAWILILVTFFSCNLDQKFTPVKNLSVFKKTEFATCLEAPISKEKNAVYCATLLFAWDQIRQKLNEPLAISDDYAALKLLDKSTSFTNVLKPTEYSASGVIEGFAIKAKAEFNKSLPFETKLQSFKGKLKFDGQNVSSFGVSGYDSEEQLKLVEIVYYKNDNNFIIKLIPKDKEHEIILFKTEQSFNTITEMNSEIKKLMAVALIEKKNRKINWKYFYNEEDVVIIPKINFNIETNFYALEGNLFGTSNQKYRIDRAWQRTAFKIDESGAEIESEAEIEAATDAKPEDEERPKKMIFDKPFLILLQRTDSENPYFGLWTTNTELMVRE